jgi:hypothetical protein
MRTFLLAAAVSAFLGEVNAGVAQFKLHEIANPPANDLYLSGSVHMSLMGSKESRFEQQRQAGAYNSTQYEAVAALTPCTNGKAGAYKCNNIDLYSFTSHAALGSSTGEGSSSWGWTSDDGREIIIVAQVCVSLEHCQEVLNSGLGRWCRVRRDQVGWLGSLSWPPA